jgi:hypothetical protein
MSEQQNSDDNKFGTGAVRSADADHLDFLSMPLIGLIGMARTTYEGGSKYGRFNYMKGMPAHVCVNHAIRHLVMWGMGDRSEPHLSHAMWNCAAADQSMVLNPELNAPHLPGPGYTLTPEILKYLDEQAPALAEKRKDKEWLKKLGGWVISGLAEIQTILGQRKTERQREWARVVNETISRHIRSEDGLRPGQVVALDEPVEVKSGDTVHIETPITIDDEGYAVLPQRKETPRDIHGRPIPQSLWIYLKDKVGVRYEEDERGPAKPGYGETWCEYEDGSRLYWLDEESKRVAKLNAVKG